MTNGYTFYFDDGDLLTFPITPGELNIKVGSKNQTVTLISEGDVNILKSPSLIEVTFEARFPMRKYPYSRNVQSFKSYFDKFKELKENKKSFRFIVARSTPKGKRLWDTNIQVALESFDLRESADEGDDVLVNITLKQYKPYGVKVLSNKSGGYGHGNRDTNGKGQNTTNYTVQPGDCLWNIAKAAYNDGSKWTVIYEANKTVIENTANKYRNGKGSSNGHWIYAGTKLIIPNANTANLNVQKLKNKSNPYYSKLTVL